MLKRYFISSSSSSPFFFFLLRQLNTKQVFLLFAKSDDLCVRVSHRLFFPSKISYHNLIVYVTVLHDLMLLRDNCFSLSRVSSALRMFPLHITNNHNHFPTSHVKVYFPFFHHCRYPYQWQLFSFFSLVSESLVRIGIFPSFLSCCLMCANFFHADIVFNLF